MSGNQTERQPKVGKSLWICLTFPTLSHCILVAGGRGGLLIIWSRQLCRCACLKSFGACVRSWCLQMEYSLGKLCYSIQRGRSGCGCGGRLVIGFEHVNVVPIFFFFVYNQSFHLKLSCKSSPEFQKTSQELRMLSSVTINCQIRKIVMNSGSQLSVL